MMMKGCNPSLMSSAEPPTNEKFKRFWTNHAVIVGTKGEYACGERAKASSVSRKT
jgi:hypothetical protein